jgi:hypothetical protein
MTTYRTKDHQQFERYEKFTIKSIATLTWIPLLIGENRVRYFEASQLTEIVDPRLTGMVYGCAEPPRALAIWRPTIELPIWELGYFRPGSKQKAIPGMSLNMSNVRLVLTLPEAA